MTYTRHWTSAALGAVLALTLALPAAAADVATELLPWRGLYYTPGAGGTGLTVDIDANGFIAAQFYAYEEDGRPSFWLAEGFYEAADAATLVDTGVLGTLTTELYVAEDGECILEGCTWQGPDRHAPEPRIPARLTWSTTRDLHLELGEKSWTLRGGYLAVPESAFLEGTWLVRATLHETGAEAETAPLERWEVAPATLAAADFAGCAADADSPLPEDALIYAVTVADDADADADAGLFFYAADASRTSGFFRATPCGDDGDAWALTGAGTAPLQATASDAFRLWLPADAASDAFRELRFTRALPAELEEEATQNDLHAELLQPWRGMYYVPGAGGMGLTLDVDGTGVAALQIYAYEPDGRATFYLGEGRYEADTDDGPLMGSLETELYVAENGECLAADCEWRDPDRHAPDPRIPARLSWTSPRELHLELGARSWDMRGGELSQADEDFVGGDWNLILLQRDWLQGPARTSDGGAVTITPSALTLADFDLCHGADCAHQWDLPEDAGFHAWSGTTVLGPTGTTRVPLLYVSAAQREIGYLEAIRQGADGPLTIASFSVFPVVPTGPDTMLVFGWDPHYDQPADHIARLERTRPLPQAEDPQVE